MKKLKQCSKCGVEKPLRDFWTMKNKKGKTVRRSLCKSCMTENNKKYKQKPEVKEKLKQYYKDNVKKFRQYYLDNKESFIKYNRKNRSKLKSTWLSHPQNLKDYKIRGYIYAALRGRSKGTTGKYYEYLGCTGHEYAKYIESMLPPEWNWDNYGSVWNIDHIVPTASVNVLDDEIAKKVYHYTNTRPLSVTDNRKRNDKVEIV